MICWEVSIKSWAWNGYTLSTVGGMIKASGKAPNCSLENQRALLSRVMTQGEPSATTQECHRRNISTRVFIYAVTIALYKGVHTDSLQFVGPCQWDIYEAHGEIDHFDSMCFM